MAASNRSEQVTFAELEALGDDACAEIINGVIVEKARPTMEHGHAQWNLGSYLVRRFARRPGGRWPGGWWFGTTELLSPSNEKRDLVDKMRVLDRAGVPHYWIGSPEEKTLVVHRWSDSGPWSFGSGSCSSVTKWMTSDVAAVRSHRARGSPCHQPSGSRRMFDILTACRV